MTSSSAKECGVCNQEYDEEERCPRILPCTHCLCTECINKLIRNNNKSCPFCRQPFKAWSASVFGRNTSLLELMKYIADLETKTASLDSSKGSPHTKKLDELKSENEKICCQNIDRLRQAGEQIVDAVTNNTAVLDDILEEIATIENDFLSKINEILVGCYEKVRYFKLENHLINKTLDAIQENQKKMEKVKEKFVSSSSFKDVGKVIDEAEKGNAQVETWLQNFKIIIQNDETERLEIRKTNEEIKGKLSIVQEVLNFYADEKVIKLRDKMVSMDDSHSTQDKLTLLSLKERQAGVMSLVKKGKVFAIQRLYGIRRSAQISLSDDNELCLHHLKEGPPPHGAYVIDHSDLLSLVDPAKKLVFLELSAGKSTSGRLVIRLIPNTDLSEQFFILCLGKNGSSYANTNVLAVKNKGTEKEIVRCGDYENNDNTGGKAIRPGMKKDEGGLVKAWEAGTLDGVWISDILTAKFDICMKTRPKSMLQASFGCVEKGISLLAKAVSRYPNASDIRFSDCGVILL